MDILINDSSTTTEADVKHSRTGGKQWTINARHSSSGIPRELNCRVLQPLCTEVAQRMGEYHGCSRSSLDSFLEINPLTLIPIGHICAIKYDITGIPTWMIETSMVVRYHYSKRRLKQLKQSNN